MKKMLMLLSASMITISTGTGILGSAFISCRNPKNKKTQSTPEEDGNFQYGSIQSISKFNKDDFKRYVDSSLTPIISLLCRSFLGQDANKNDFDFITLFNSLKDKRDPCNAVVWNRQSASCKNYCVDTFLDDWTFSELEQEYIDLIKSIFISRKNESEKQNGQSWIDILKKIKHYKKVVKDKIKNTENITSILNHPNLRQLNIDDQMLRFINDKLIEKIPSPFLKVKPRFEQILNNFVNATNFDDIKDLTDVNGQNLISYIKKPENIKKMNENFNSKTNDEKALMLFTIKFNYMYKYLSATDANPENGQFLSEALFKDINVKNLFDFNLLKLDFESSSICKKITENFQKISENFINYFEDIFKNNNGEKSLEPFFCLVEGIMFIVKQKFYKAKIDEPIKKAEVKLETIFECICEFVTVIKGNIKDNSELKRFKIEDGKNFMKDLLSEASLLEGMFIENESINKTNVLSSMGLVASSTAYYFGVGLLSTPLVGVGLIAGGLAWWYNKTDNTSVIPININDNLKNYYNKSWLVKILNLMTDKVNIAKVIDSFDLEGSVKNIVNELHIMQDYKEYIQVFDKVKNEINDKDNNLLKELQHFIDQGGFKGILTACFKLIDEIKSVDDKLTDKEKKQEISNALNDLLKSIGLDRQKKNEDMIVNGSVLNNLIEWINRSDNSIDKTFDKVVKSLEEEKKQWNNEHFENHVNNLATIIKDKKDIEIEYVSFEEVKDNSGPNLIIRLNYKLKILTTNEVYDIEFKNKNFKKFSRNFKISKFKKLT